jgi:hypothetical protein
LKLREGKAVRWDIFDEESEAFEAAAPSK